MKVSKLFSVVALSCGVAFASSAAIAGTVSTDGSTSMEKVRFFRESVDSPNEIEIIFIRAIC